MEAVVTAPTEAEVEAAVARLRSRDAGTLAVVEPLARQLPREVFQHVLETLARRTNSGSVANDAGLLVKLLRVAIREQARLAAKTQLDAAAAPQRPAQLGVVERVKRDEPERYIAAMRDRPGFELEAYLARYVHDEAERARLRELAA